MSFSRTLNEDEITDRRSAIAARREGIRREQEAIAREMDVLAKEDDELQIVLRVLARLHPMTPDDDIVTTADDVFDVEMNGEEPAGRPEGIPTVRDMILRLLRSNAKEGGVGLSLQEVIDGIRKTWWPNATSANIRPTLWRMHSKENVVLRVGERHRIAEQMTDTMAALLSRHENEADTA